MKSWLLLLLLISTTPVFGQKVKKKLVYKKIGTYYSDLNNDGIIDTITIASSIGTPFYFNKITVKLAGQQAKSFIAKDSWTVVDKFFLDSNKNALKTKMLFLKKTPQQSVIVLFGELDGAGYRGEFSIINIENNQVKMVFDHYNDNVYVEAPETVRPFRSGFRLCFIYTQISEFDGTLKNGNVGVYHPYYVYPIDDSCKLNKPLTKAYNEEYYVFAGYKYSEKVRVFYPNNHSKPILLKRKRNLE